MTSLIDAEQMSILPTVGMVAKFFSPREIDFFLAEYFDRKIP